MHSKRSFTLILLLVFLPSFLAVAFANLTVGVKQGDWVEYDVSFTGTPPVEHDVVWARMNITSVNGTMVDAVFVSRLENGSMLDVEENLDLDAGRLIDMFIIPAGLNVGDKFYDQIVGNITIDGVEVRSYAGASRTVVHADAVDTHWYWDQATGVTLEARTANAVYNLDTVAMATNLWAASFFGLDSTTLYISIIVVLVIIVAAVIIVFRRNR
jgi:hypothetical protein